MNRYSDERPPEVPGAYKREAISYADSAQGSGRAEQAPPTPEHDPPPPRRPRKRKSAKASVALALVLCCAFSALAGGTAGYLVSRNTDQQATVSPVSSGSYTSAITAQSSADPGNDLSVVDINKLVSPAAVSINVSALMTGFRGQSVEQESGAGSGFIISEDGYVVTNNHVVSGASSVSVVLLDGTEYTAQVVGLDSTTDLAVLKIDAKGLPYVALGDSDAMEIGEQVVAIGNPLGEFAGSITVGYISARGRELSFSDSTMSNLIQTDAAINPGNSGGALVNMRGEVIGINTAKSSGSQVEGLGFAIPINDAKPIIDDLMQNGYVTGRPYIGISTENVDEYTAVRYNMPQGVYVAHVESGSPADKAGIQASDIITRMEGEAIVDGSDLISLRNQHAPGDTIAVTLYRSGQELEVKLTLGEDMQAS